MKRAIATVFLSGSIQLMLLYAAAAQTQVRGDPTLSMLHGKWEGIAEIDNQPMPCEKNFRWILQDAFLECETRIWQDPAKRTLFIEEREYVRPSGEDRITSYVFSSRGQTRWGAYKGPGQQWNAAMQYSDGMEETVLMDLQDSDNITFITTLQGPDGVVIRSTTVRLHRAEGRKR